MYSVQLKFYYTEQLNLPHACYIIDCAVICNQRSIHKNNCMGFHSLKCHYLMSGVNCEVYWGEEVAISDRDKIMIYNKYILRWFNISSEKEEKNNNYSKALWF